MTPNKHSHENAYYMTLGHLGILHIEGEDAQALLQNLLTNDVNALAINQSQLTGLCNPKGRLLAIFLLLRRSNAYQLILPKSMCAGLQQRLSMYILRSKVTITDVSNDLSFMGLSSEATVSSFTAPDEIYHATEHGNSIIIKYPGTQSRYLFIGSQIEVSTLISDLDDQGWHFAAESQWELLDIEAGLPMVFPETKEQFTTQQVNLDLINGVSFKKGCYPGQEIVARLHYLGTPSRRMFQAVIQTDQDINVGEEVRSDNGDIAGHIVRVERKDNDTLLMLLSIKLSEGNKILFVHENAQVTILNKDLIS